MTPKTHQRICEQVSAIPLVDINPYSAAKIADNKFQCYQIWKNENLYTPPAAFFERNSFQDVQSLLDTIQEHFELFFSQPPRNETVYLLFQPNQGTEGRLTRAFYGPPHWDPFLEQNQDILLQAKRILDQDDMILRKGIGNVLWYDPSKQTREYFDIRVNVIDGIAESGYLMVAEKNSFISSPGQSGRVVEWKTKEWHLQTPDGIQLFQFGGSEWKAVWRAAEQASGCVSACRMVGVDIRLEWFDSQLNPWILDVNPRPAGLAHSRFFETFEPGVTLQLWK